LFAESTEVIAEAGEILACGRQRLMQKAPASRPGRRSRLDGRQKKTSAPATPDQERNFAVPYGDRRGSKPINR
jgi:hypothetical protein